MNFVIWWSAVALAGVCSAERWQWPEQAASVRIDTKVRFLDQDDEQRGHVHVQADEAPFHEPAQTDGFYNRAGGAGRYPVRVDQPTRFYKGNNHYSDGTLDSLDHCKCVSNPDCNPRGDSARACGAGKFLCCYKGSYNQQQNTEYFNEIENERPFLLPGQEEPARPFPPVPGYNREQGVLVGPGGPTGHIGPGHANKGGSSGVLVGPDGPTGIIGPNRQNNGATGVLVGPDGPTGIIGPHGHNENVHAGKRNPDILVGPEGPTNIIGPAPVNGHRDVGSSETAQRGILVGPGGPTGIIGPRGYGQQRPVLVGPGGPTGIIGPRMQGFFNGNYGRQRNPGILVGPGGPTGIIGPGRQLLVGPGGPTGRIGPQNYFV